MTRINITFEEDTIKVVLSVTLCLNSWESVKESSFLTVIFKTLFFYLDFRNGHLYNVQTFVSTSFTTGFPLQERSMG